MEKDQHINEGAFMIAISDKKNSKIQNLDVIIEENTFQLGNQ